MKLTHAVTKTVSVEIDTDAFTPAQWKAFIIENVSSAEIIRTMKTDLFGIERLKERACIIFQMMQQDLW